MSPRVPKNIQKPTFDNDEYVFLVNVCKDLTLLPYGQLRPTPQLMKLSVNQQVYYSLISENLALLQHCKQTFSPLCNDSIYFYRCINQLDNFECSSGSSSFFPVDPGESGPVLLSLCGARLLAVLGFDFPFIHTLMVFCILPPIYLDQVGSGRTAVQQTSVISLTHLIQHIRSFEGQSNKITKVYWPLQKP